MASPCCPTDIKPAINNYKGVGKTVTVDGGLECYMVGPSTSDNAVIAVTDVFGITPNAQQFSDALAQATGSLVCMPAFIQDPWDVSNIPPTKDGKFPKDVEPADGFDCIMNWILNSHDMRMDRDDQFQAVKAFLGKEYNATKFGAVGMCWGAKPAFHAAGNGLIDAVAAVHGSFLNKDDAKKCNVPICFLNSKDEPETYATDIKPVMDSKPFKDKNVYKDYPTIHHGWMGSRGIGCDNDFTQQEQVAMFAQGISDLTNFFATALA